MSRNHSKNLIWLYILSALFIISAVYVFIYFAHQKPSVEKEVIPEYEINGTVFLSELLDESKKDKMVTRDMMIPLTEIGEKSIEITVKNNVGIKYNTFVRYKCIDTEAPVIKLKESVVFLENGEEYDFDNVIESISDNSSEDIKATHSGFFDCNTMGEYKIEYEARDSSGNIGTAKLKIIVEQNRFDIDEKGNFSLVDGRYTTEKGKYLVIKNGVASIDDILIINKTYPLPKNYTAKFSPEAKSAYEKMNEAAKALGIKLSLESEYRSYDIQKTKHSGYIKAKGEEESDTFSARASHSEHQSGLAIDIMCTDPQNMQKYTDTFEWLEMNAYKYGFILRYPENKEKITGYAYAPWHYRYIGKELAKTLYNNGKWITLEEYFGIDSEYKY